MPINIETDELGTVEDVVSAVLPICPSYATRQRWQTVGSHGKVLETVRIGGRIYTTKQAFINFASPRGTSDD